MSLANRKFSVQVADPIEGICRASQRVLLNAEVLKQAKLFAGDVVALYSADPSGSKDGAKVRPTPLQHLL